MRSQVWFLLLFLAPSCGWLDSSDREPVFYEVERGDTLFVIARDHGVSLEELMGANGLDNDRIEVGQRLLIPEEGVAAVAPSPSPTRSGGRPRPTRPAPGGEDMEQLEQPDPTPTPPRLSMPTAKTCLQGPRPEDLSVDDGALLSQGLSASQVRSAMNAFLPKLDSCFWGMATSPSGTLMFDIKVRCNGQVSTARMTSRGDWPSQVASCVETAFAFIPFPAHDYPDGYTFQYPLKVQ